VFYSQRENLVVQAVNDETLILDLTSEKIHHLNSSASLIWGLCNSAVSLDWLENEYAEHYEVEPATAQADVKNIIDQLIAMGLITTV
jgi:Coenzyme PQQ synthesis protein D (PqqD)